MDFNILELDQSNCSHPSSEHCPHRHFICLCSCPVAPITLEQGKLGLIRPCDLLPFKKVTCNHAARK